MVRSFREELGTAIRILDAYGQFLERTDLQQLSNRELFWAAESAYHVSTEILAHQ